MEILFALFVIYQIKHFLADFPLQGKYMLGKFKPGYGWILPLLAHVSVHGLFTFLIAFPFILFRIEMSSRSLLSMGLPPDYGLVALFALKLAIFDMVVHFTMDRIKASPNLLGRFKALSASEMGVIIENFKHYALDPASPTTRDSQPVDEAKLKSNTLFWWALGIDQMVHHLTHYIIIYMLVR